jgi:hypothetical protein
MSLINFKLVIKNNKWLRWVVDSSTLKSMFQFPLSIYHKYLERQLALKVKNGQKIRVVFLVVHRSVWKLDELYKKMFSDDLFDPIILICPYTAFGEEQIWSELYTAFDDFSKKGYNVLCSFNKEINSWIKLKDIKPDIVFFTNPHDLTYSEYYYKAFASYLSCYAGYGVQVTKYKNHQPLFNQYFHNFMWKIFWQHQEVVNISKVVMANKGKNVFLSGDTNIESLTAASAKQACSNRWKRQSHKKKKIIWAPHHTIDTEYLPYSNFLKYHQFFKDIALKYKDQIQWAFKPHPILKYKLSIHPDWGEDKVNSYYDFWCNSDFAQLEEGEYIDLFVQSDGMVHDSAAFLGEYLFLNKPVMYLCKKEMHQFYNDFGVDALKACYQGYKELDIENFLLECINSDSLEKSREKFIHDHSDILGSGRKPSDNILEEIKSILKN